jgi:hypothetical protein
MLAVLLDRTRCALCAAVSPHGSQDGAGPAASIRLPAPRSIRSRPSRASPLFLRSAQGVRVSSIASEKLVVFDAGGSQCEPCA